MVAEAITLLWELGPWGVALSLLLLPPPLLLAAVVIALLRGWRPWQRDPVAPHTLSDDQLRNLVKELEDRMEASCNRLGAEIVGLRKRNQDLAQILGDATAAAQLARQTAEETARALEVMGRSVHDMSGQVAGLATQLARLAALLQRREGE